MTHQIDTFSEKILSLDGAAKHLSKISGTKRNRRILQRWSNLGVSGIKLPTIQIGGELYTSQQALNWFLNASRQAKRERHGRATSAGIAQSQYEANRQGYSREASDELAEAESDVEQAARDLGI